MSKLLAPNGKPSNLNPKQYKLVRSKEFISWFGDWEKDPANASKVVDENGEPLVVYRGMPKKRRFGNIFNYNVNLFIENRKKNKFAFYFSRTKEEAEIYGFQSAEYNDDDYIVKEYFLKINNLFLAVKKDSVASKSKININSSRPNRFNLYDKPIPEIDKELGKGYLTFKELFDLAKPNKKDFELLNTEYTDNEDAKKEYEEEQERVSAKPIYWHFIDISKNDKKQDFWRNYLKDIKKYDGLMFYEDTHALTFTGRGKNEKAILQFLDNPNTICVFEPNQIKLADGTNTTFDANNPDIRFKDGGATNVPTKFWGNVAGGVLIYCSSTDKYLLLKRSSHVQEPNTWGIISGKLDDDENVEEAVKRETEEETGFELNNLIPAFVFKSNNFVFHNFISVVKEEFEPTLNWENTEYGWFKFNEFPKDLHFGLELLIKNSDLKGLIKVGAETPTDSKSDLHFLNELLSASKDLLDLISETGSKKDVDFLKSKIEATENLISLLGNNEVVVKNPILLAPNGKPSKLTPEQYKLVRKPEFKAWFGDWEKDPANASKVVDENGEPLICYHGTDNEFYEFDVNKQRNGRLGKGFYISENKIEAENYGERLLKVFLNIKNPFIIQGDINEDGTIKWELNIEGQISEKYNEVNADDISTTLKKFNNDGILEGSRISCFYPEQIKLADGTNTTFDSDNPDIRFDDGGEVEKYEIGGIYQGTPHNFNAYSTEYIGTGEGNQVFGWGLYFTNNKDIARYYMSAGLYDDEQKIKLDNKSLSEYNIKQEVKDQLVGVVDTIFGEDKMIPTINSIKDYLILEYDKENYPEFKEIAELSNKTYDFIKDKKLSFIGNIYSVTLFKGKKPNQYNLLDWNKKPTKKILSLILKQLDKDGIYYQLNGKSIMFKRDNKDNYFMSIDLINGMTLYNGISSIFYSEDKQASMFLLRAGIDGIRYEAGTLSGFEDKDGYNYVIFDADNITIEGKEKYDDILAGNEKYAGGGEINTGFFSQIWEWFGIKF